MKSCIRTTGGFRGLRALCLVVTVAASLLFQNFGFFIFATGKGEQKNEAFVSETKISSTLAIASQQGVLLKWSTSFELDNVGFNIYRSRDGKRIRINSDIVVGSVFIAGEKVPLRAGHSYSWFDASGTADSSYSIEAIGLDGTITSSGQVTPEWKDKLLGGRQLEDSNTFFSAQGTTSRIEYPAASVEPTTAGQIEDQWAIASQAALKISVKKDGWYHVTQQQMAAAGFSPITDIANLRLFLGARELAILTNRAAGQLVTGDFIEFYGQGLDTPTADSKTYYLIAGPTAGKRIVTARKRIPGQVRSESSPVTPAQPQSGLLPQLEFNTAAWFWWLPRVSEDSAVTGPAQITTKEKANSSPQTTDNVVPSFVLPGKTSEGVSPRVNLNESVRTEAKSDEPRAKAENRRLTPVVSKPFNKRIRRKGKKPRRLKHQYAHALKREAAAASGASFDYTVESKERKVYFVSLLNGDAENFFGQVLSSTPVQQTLTILNPETTVSVPARLEIALQGASSVNHVVTVQLNGNSVDTIGFFGLAHIVRTIEIPVSQLNNGENIIRLIPTTGTGLSIVDYVRLTYAHSYRADNDSLRFSLAPSQSARIDGFNTSSVRVIDYSDPFTVKLIKPLVELNGSSYTIQVSGSQSSPRLLYAIPEGQAESPVLSINQPSSLNLNSNAADLLIIAHGSLISSLTPLVDLRSNQGMTVSVVDVEDVYDEFSYGMHGPQAIRDFLAYASSHWTKAPRYVIFAGDASYDPRNYLGFGDRDFVPTKLVDASFNETSSDDWLTDFNNDGIADIPVGRLPVATTSQANIMVSKIVNFSPTNVPQSALLVADAQGSYYFNFEQANTQVQSLLPPSMTVQRVDRRTEPSDAQASANIISKLNAGQALLNYSGHGNVNTWTNASIFTSANALALTNGNKLPFVVVMDCLNGYFQEPNPDISGLGLAEAFLRAPSGGAVAAFASSGLTIPDGQHAMGLQLYTLLYGSQSIALGDAIKSAKSATNDVDVRRTWIFFGDPSMKIR